MTKMADNLIIKPNKRDTKVIVQVLSLCKAGEVEKRKLATNFCLNCLIHSEMIDHCIKTI